MTFDTQGQGQVANGTPVLTGLKASALAMEVTILIAGGTGGRQLGSALQNRKKVILDKTEDGEKGRAARGMHQ